MADRPWESMPAPKSKASPAEAVATPPERKSKKSSSSRHGSTDHSQKSSKQRKARADPEPKLEPPSSPKIERSQIPDRLDVNKLMRQPKKPRTATLMHDNSEGDLINEVVRSDQPRFWKEMARKTREDRDKKIADASQTLEDDPEKAERQIRMFGTAEQKAALQKKKQKEEEREQRRLRAEQKKKDEEARRIQAEKDRIAKIKQDEIDAKQAILDAEQDALEDDEQERKAAKERRSKQNEEYRRIQEEKAKRERKIERRRERFRKEEQERRARIEEQKAEDRSKKNGVTASLRGGKHQKKVNHSLKSQSSAQLRLDFDDDRPKKLQASRRSKTFNLFKKKLKL